MTQSQTRLHPMLTRLRDALAVLLAMAAVAGLMTTASGIAGRADDFIVARGSLPENQGSDVRAKPLKFAQTVPPAQSSDNSVIGGVASASGGSNVTRGDQKFNLSAGNDIFAGDVLQTGNDGALGVTFDDETTLTLGANTQVSVSSYVYDKPTKTAAVFNVARGTLAFIAGQVAKTGDMKINTPTASFGIRGTTGIVDVPVDQAGAPGDTRVKLYQDQGGTVGRIEIFDNTGARLALLSRASTGFAVRIDQALSRSLGQQRFAAVAIQIAPIELARDQSQVRQLFATHTIGRQIINLRRGGGGGGGGVTPPGLQRVPSLQGPPGQQGPAQQPALRGPAGQRQNAQRAPKLQRTTGQRVPADARKALKRLPGQKNQNQQTPGVPNLR